MQKIDKDYQEFFEELFIKSSEILRSMGSGENIFDKIIDLHTDIMWQKNIIQNWDTNREIYRLRRKKKAKKTKKTP